MEHRATAGFWQTYRSLPDDIRLRADKQFALLKTDPLHPSLQFKKVGVRLGQELWSARVTLNYRALALKQPGGYMWFWVGDHAGYETLIS